MVVIIPARYDSQRLPGKPLLSIGGKPLIQHVYETAKASAAERVIIATDDDRIFYVAKKLGAEVVMTGECSNGTERVIEAAIKTGIMQNYE